MAKIRLVRAMLVALTMLAACGNDDDTTAMDSDDPATETMNGESDVEADDADGDDGSGDGAATADGGTISIDGATYTVVADRQCLISDSAGQYYISGSLPDVDAAGAEFSYSRDDRAHRIQATLPEGEYFTMEGDIESEIDGNVVTGTATLTPSGHRADPLSAEFRFEC